MERISRFVGRTGSTRRYIHRSKMEDEEEEEDKKLVEVTIL